MPATIDSTEVAEENAGRSGWRARVAIGGLAAALFLVAGSPSLGTIGPHHDELGQACAAFAWAGRPPPFFAQAHVAGVPLFISRYAGAAKAAVFGPWLALRDGRFDMVEYRWFGLILAAAGILALALLGGAALRPAPLAVLAGLTATDLALLLLTRHDRGPVAMGFLVRALFVGTWLLGLRAPRARSAFALGALAGLAVWEKITSAALGIPLLLMLLLDPRRRNFRHLGAAFAGGILGALPLIAVNVRWLAAGGPLATAAPGLESQARTLGGLGEHLLDVAALGSGDSTRSAVLGVRSPAFLVYLEAGAALALLLAVVVVALRSPAGVRRRILVPALSWPAIALFLFALPERTLDHHWIAGVPFLPAAAALALASPDRSRSGAVLLLAAVAALIGGRVAMGAGVVSDLAAGRHAREWSPQHAALGAFAAGTPPDTVFIAAEWGVAPQIFCASGGRPGIVHEVYRTYAGPQDLERCVRGRREVFVVAPARPFRAGILPLERIYADAAALPGFETVPTPAPLRELRALRVLHLRR